MDPIFYGLCDLKCTSIIVTNGGLRNDDLTQTDDVLVTHHLEEFDFADGRDGKTLADDFGVARINLLQGHKIVRLEALSLVHLTVRT